MTDEVEVIILGDQVIFLENPPEELKKILRELGLDFREEVIYCG